MVLHYITVAFRNLWKYRFYSSLNLIGLAIGMASCLLILIHVRSEWSYDRFHPYADQSYRVATHAFVQDSETDYPFIGYKWGDLMMNEMQDITAVTRLFGGRQPFVVKKEQELFEEQNFFFVDSTYQDLFQLEFIKGNPERVLRSPNSILITEAIAHKYFGGADPMGQVLTVEIGQGEVEVTVDGIIKAYPKQAHFHPDFLASMTTLHKAFGGVEVPFFQSLVFTSHYTYIRTDDPESVQRQLNQAYETQIPEQGKEFIKGLFLQPLADIHLTSRLIGEIEQNGNELFVYIFLLVAILTLLIACINYVNLTTALAGNRSKEVGMRKVVGAHRVELIRQFLTESVVIAFIAMVLAWGFTLLMQNLLARSAGLKIEIDYGSGFFWLALLCLTLFAGLIAGSYPALVLSRFEPLQVLRGRLKMGVKGKLFRQILVGFQFGVSTALMIGTGILFLQLRYIATMDMGFDKSQRVIIPLRLDGTPQEQIQTIERIKYTLTQHPGIHNATATGSIPGQPRGIGRVHVEGQSQDIIHQPVSLPVDFNYVSTMGMQIIAGRDFDLSYGMDSTQSVLINEGAIQKMELLAAGTPIDEVLKSRLTFLPGQIGQNIEGQTVQVVGVFQDMHFEPIHREIHPMILRIQPQQWANLIVHIQTIDQKSTLDFIADSWEQLAPERAFSYTFLDQELAEIYQSDQEMGSLISFFTLLAVLIACLGLFGLSAFTTQQRRKEISIRKVLGAEPGSIVALLTKEFLILVLIAFPFAAFLAWRSTSIWLESFAYHAQIGPGIYALSGLLAMTIAFLTVSYLSYRAAVANPADSLYRE